MTKQTLLARIDSAIKATQGDIKRSAQLARKYRAEKEKAFAGGGPNWAERHQVASNLESLYTMERDAAISQLRMLKGIVR